LPLFVYWFFFSWSRQGDYEHGTWTVFPIAGCDSPAHRFDKPPAHCKAESCSGALSILGVHPIEFVKDPFEIGGR
jgi:hypothetical protein